ncbi:MAG: HAD family hydrolase [Paracoccaceae bacterium]|nr:HAD family hydrolase [Paracoccaceae bacterium]MDG1738404.1 HAD family hydrolase [Paracoccaceae bacterium]MDG2259849.1 HAD family hydrolase [Paracoccaceae bacterium]
MKIAMWSGPRNLSTAMMYSFGARSDCAVVDEPFYAAYLDRTGIDHPMRAETMASQSLNSESVAAGLIGSNPAQKRHYYQKHMTQHMVAGIPRDWMAEVKNIFLIRHPARVVASFAKKYPNVAETDIGFVQQLEIYDHVIELGQQPIVVDSYDIRQNPEASLVKLCNAIGIEWDASMLHWPKGGHPADGVWAAHWYDAVHSSDGFASAEGSLPQLTGRLDKLVESVLPAYQKMAARKLI